MIMELEKYNLYIKCTLKLLYFLKFLCKFPVQTPIKLIV